jgi:sulfur carrier protein
MHIKVNGKEHELPGDMAPVLAVLVFLDIDSTQTGIAVALNLEVVPRSAWANTMVEHNDQLEIIRAMQGG